MSQATPTHAEEGVARDNVQAFTLLLQTRADEETALW